MTTLEPRRPRARCGRGEAVLLALAALAPFSLLASCQASDDGSAVAAAPDASSSRADGGGKDLEAAAGDAPLRDAASPTPDADAAGVDAAALPDATAPRDATLPDAELADASFADAATIEAAAPTPTVCPELATTNPWADLTGGHGLADRGTVLACAHLGSWSASQVAAGASSLGPVTNGYDLFIVQYLSEGAQKAPQAVTALLYLPSGHPTAVPIVAVDHPTSGLGPTCGPTHQTALVDAMAVPLVTRGFAVVATDYGGMGVDNGMTSYLIGHAEASATLDAVRALLRFHESRFDAAQLGTDFFVLGHSQGGHAALFTHQEFSPGMGVTLLGSVALAPGPASALAMSQGFDSASRPDDTAATFGAMGLYAQMLAAGGPPASDWLTPSAATALPGWFHDQCGASLVQAVQGRFGTQGDLFQSTFMLAAAACPFTAPCPGFEPWSSALLASEPGAFTSGAPVLVLQGGADTTVSPAATACIVKRLAAHGTAVQGCLYAGDSHTSIVDSALGDALRWMQGRRVGQVLDVCPAPLAATACDD